MGTNLVKNSFFFPSPKEWFAAKYSKYILIPYLRLIKFTFIFNPFMVIDYKNLKKLCRDFGKKKMKFLLDTRICGKISEFSGIQILKKYVFTEALICHKIWINGLLLYIKRKSLIKIYIHNDNTFNRFVYKSYHNLNTDWILTTEYNNLYFNYGTRLHASTETSLHQLALWQKASPSTAKNVVTAFTP